MITDEQLLIDAEDYGPNEVSTLIANGNDELAEAVAQQNGVTICEECGGTGEIWDDFDSEGMDTSDEDYDCDNNFSVNCCASCGGRGYK